MADQNPPCAGASQFIVSCTNVHLDEPVSSDSVLTCRFSDASEVPAQYNAATGCVSCCPSAATVLADREKLVFEVVDSSGHTLLQRLLSDADVLQCEHVDASVRAPSSDQESEKEQFLISCSNVKLPPSSYHDGQQLRCCFNDSTEVPAQYDSQHGRLCCRPPADKVALHGFSVLDSQGNTLLERLMSDAMVERVGDLKQAPGTGHGEALEVEGVGAPGGPDAGGGGAGDVSRGAAFRARYSALKPFVIISSSYLLFTVTDGAMRMIVLLHAYSMGFSAMEVAIMFSLYELAGVFTNFLAGIAGARWGIKSTLLIGLSLQLVAIGMLYGWQDDWAKSVAIIYVTISQMLGGIAKDLTKLGGKTVTKLVTPDERQSSLFKLVSLITGWKNSLKGAGYFLGSVMVIVSYYAALGLLQGLILLAMPWAVFGLSNSLGRARKENIKAATIFKKNYNVNMLSLSRVFLFGCRDLWFEVPLPFFMRDAAYGLGWGRAPVGALLAAFIIVYGQIQSWTPQLVTKPLRQSPPNKWVATLWCGLLSIIPVYLAIVLLLPLFDANEPSGPRVAVLMPGVAIFAAIFAVNSSIHSYLIVRYSNNDKVAMNVGFYYMANAVGRLTGTLLGGALYTYVGGDVATGLSVCFWASCGFAVISSLFDLLIHDDKGGLKCGPCLALCPGSGANEEAIRDSEAAQPCSNAAVVAVAPPAIVVT